MKKHKLIIYWSALALLFTGDVCAMIENVTANAGATNTSESARAIEKRRAQKVQKFIRGIDINVKKECNLYFKDPFQQRKKIYHRIIDKVPALTLTLFRSNYRVAKLLIEKGADPCVKSEYLKFTHLMYLLLKLHYLDEAYAKYCAMCNRFLSEVRIPDDVLETYNSIKNNILKCISWLLDQGAYRGSTNNFGETAFLLAARYAQPEVMKLLLKQREVEGSIIGLLLDSKHKKPRSNDYLKETLKKTGYPVSLDRKDVDGRTALMLAILSPNNPVKLEPGLARTNNPFNVQKLIDGEKVRTEMVKMLLKHGANPDIKDIYGKTALDYAYLRNYTEIVKMLKAVQDKRKEKEPDKIFYTMNNDELKEFIYAVREGNVNVMASYLNKEITVDGKSVSATLSPKNLNQAVKNALPSRRLAAIKWLVEKGTYIQEDSHGNPLLCKKLEISNMESIEFVLKNGINPNQKNRWKEDGNTPLIELSRHMYAGVVPTLIRLLMKYGADINGTNNWGETPLIAAVKVVHLDHVRALLECGADVSKKDKRGLTARDYASQVLANPALDEIELRRAKDILEALKQAENIAERSERTEQNHERE